MRITAPSTSSRPPARFSTSRKPIERSGNCAWYQMCRPCPPLIVRTPRDRSRWPYQPWIRSSAPLMASVPSYKPDWKRCSNDVVPPSVLVTVTSPCQAGVRARQVRSNSRPAGFGRSATCQVVIGSMTCQDSGPQLDQPVALSSLAKRTLRCSVPVVRIANPSAVSRSGWIPRPKMIDGVVASVRCRLKTNRSKNRSGRSVTPGPTSSSRKLSINPPGVVRAGAAVQRRGERPPGTTAPVPGRRSKDPPRREQPGAVRTRRALRASTAPARCTRRGW